MLLNKLRKGDQAEIIKIHADKALRDRFISFGLMRGENIIVKTCSLAKQTMEIKVGATAIALRADEAGKIEVRKLQTTDCPSENNINLGTISKKSSNLGQGIQ